MRGGVVTGVFVCAAVLAAVPATSGGAARSTWSACSLLTKPEAAAAMGVGVKSVKSTRSATGAMICNWIGAGGGIVVKHVTITAATDSGKQRWLARRSLSAGKPIKGLGTQAFLDSDGHDVVLYAGKDFLEIASSASTAALLKLAHLALPRLQKL